jgi:hypothetical protein
MSSVVSSLLAFGFAVAMGIAPLAAAQQPSRNQMVQQLYDREMILELMSRYGYTLDVGDGEAYADLFTADGSVIAGGGEEYKGREALVKLGASAGARPDAPPPPPNAPRPPIHHLYSNVHIDLKGSTATVKAYWVVLNGSTGTAVIQSMGWYEDSLIKQNGRWRYTQRRIINETLNVQRAKAAAGTR